MRKDTRLQDRQRPQILPHQVEGIWWVLQYLGVHSQHLRFGILVGPVLIAQPSLCWLHRAKRDDSGGCTQKSTFERVAAFQEIAGTAKRICKDVPPVGWCATLDQTCLIFGEHRKQDKESKTQSKGLKEAQERGKDAANCFSQYYQIDGQHKNLLDHQ